MTQSFQNDAVADSSAPETLIATPSFPQSRRKGVFDFGRDGFGWLELHGVPPGRYEIVLGELLDRAGDVANEPPGSSIRRIKVECVADADPYRVPLPTDNVNLRGYDPKAPAIRLPERFGIVMPFRYVQVLDAPKPLRAENLVRQTLHAPIDLSQSSFECDNPILNEVCELCRQSILATSFCGIYIDGDRERTPYEGDAYINQLGHFAVEASFDMSRRTIDHLMEHPTWPTEWRQHAIKLVWAHLEWSGDVATAARWYDILANDRLMLKYARRDGLMETGGEYRAGCVIPGCGDIVDWPVGERDGFEFRPVNAVVNAFHHRNLLEMADVARALGKTEDAAAFTKRAAAVREAFNAVFLDASAGLYRDGEGSNHHSLHANAAALAFGLPEPESIPRLVEFLDGKGLACSVYFAQYLLEAFCVAGRSDLAVKWMASTGERSWKNMIDFGATITMEAWNVKAKPNLDINHAWGTAPLNVISRFIVGATPLSPGFGKARVAPQPGTLHRIRAKVPTAHGPIGIDIDGGRLSLETPVPTLVEWRGTSAEVAPGRHEFS